MYSAWRNVVAAFVLLLAGVAAAQAPDPSAQIATTERADGEQLLAQGAKKEGEVSVYSSLISEDLAALFAAFEKKYGVKLKGWRAGFEILFALTTYSHGAEKMKQKGAPVDWYAIEPAIGRADAIAIVRRPPHSHAAALFADFVLSPEGQKILEQGGYVPANLTVGAPAQKLPLKFVDPALVLDGDAQSKKLWSEIVLGNAR